MGDLLVAAERDTCVDCRVTAPVTETDYTLISKTHNWRLERRREHGGLVLEWRCPMCWQRYKARGTTR